MDCNTSSHTSGRCLFVLSEQRSSPYINHFIQPDTIIPDPTSPQAWNRYSYVGNSPVNFNDPSGHDADCGIGNDNICDKEPRNNSPLIIFSADPGQSWTDDEKEAINKGAEDIGKAIAREINSELRELRKTGEITEYDQVTATEAFLLVYGGPVKVVRKNAGCKEGCWGRAISANEIWIYSNASVETVLGHPRLIIHELGHSFARAMEKGGVGTPYENMKGVTSRNGFYGPLYSWQLSSSNEATEVYADMFIGWVYNKWEIDKATGNTSAAGEIKRNSMNITIEQIMKLIGY